jgi:multicomponent Na+:H+ antiporter subunit F
VTTSIFVIAAAWMTVLLVASLVKVIRARSTASRILALDMLILIIVALLVLFSSARGTPHLMETAIVLSLLSLVATLAAARYYRTGRVFS